MPVVACGRHSRQQLIHPYFTMRHGKNKLWHFTDADSQLSQEDSGCFGMQICPPTNLFFSFFWEWRMMQCPSESLGKNQTTRGEDRFGRWGRPLWPVFSPVLQSLTEAIDETTTSEDKVVEDMLLYLKQTELF